MSSNTNDLLLRLFGRIVQLVDDDVEFRSDLCLLVESARHALREGDAVSVPLEPELSVGSDQSLDEVLVERTPEDQYSDVVAECEGDANADIVADKVSKVEARAQRPQWKPTTDDDLPAVEDRCRLKVEATRWATTRKAEMNVGCDFRTEIAPMDRTFFERANEIGDCALWMLQTTWRMPNDDLPMEHLGVCFGVLAEALQLVRVALRDLPSTNFFEQSIVLLAEAQSALRVAVERVNDRGDWDQAAVFTWLRSMASERQILIPRYMRLDDSADPANSSDLLARIEALATQVNNTLSIARERRRLFGKMHYLLGQLAQEHGERVQNWQTMAHTIGELIATGVPPSNKEIRESLLPVIDTLPFLHDAPEGFSKVLDELSRHRASQQRSVASPRKATIPSEVKQVRTLLRKKAVLLIGGHCRNHARKKIERALKLKRLDWISTTEHESVEHFRAAVANPDVAVVLLAIRFSSHSFGQVQKFCKEYGKPLVRLPSGYNPSRVAFHILNQCGDRLNSMCSPSS